MDSEANYIDKKKKLFDSLISAEECIKGTALEQIPMIQTIDRQSDDSRSVSRRFHGRESIFKRPAAPISKCLRPRQSPDYQVNPHKWKRYTLTDADISDRSNATAAFQFLAEIEKNKQRSEEMDESGSDSDKIVFRNRRKPTFHQSSTLKHKVATRSNEGEQEKIIMKGSKVVMPEYVIGAKPKAKEKKKSSSLANTDKDRSSKKQVLQLQHLMDDEAEDDE